MDCIEQLIGLAPTASTCWTDEAEAGDSVSTSGYFVTDDDFGAPVLKKLGIAAWEIMRTARANAIRSFRTDLSSMLMQEYGSVISGGKTLAGKRQIGSLALASKANAGIKIEPVFCRGGKFIIEKIWFGGSYTGNLTIRINGTPHDFTEQTAVIAAESGKYKSVTLDTPLELPFWTDDGFAPEYYVSYATSPSWRHYLQPVACCGQRPQSSSHFRFGGFEADDALPTGEVGVTSGSTKGLVLEGCIICDPLTWLCNCNSLGGYDTMSVVARTIQFRAAANSILAIPQMTGGAYSEAEQSNRLNFLNTRYTENVAWLSENANIRTLTDCLSCKEPFRKAKILV